MRASSAASSSGCSTRAVGVDALRHFEPQAPRDERLGQLDEEIVELVLVLAPHLERVAEPFGRDEPGARALALDQRVGEERRRVHDARDVAVRDALRVEEPAYARDDADVRRVRRRQLLVAERDGARCWS